MACLSNDREPDLPLTPDLLPTLFGVLHFWPKLVRLEVVFVPNKLSSWYSGRGWVGTWIKQGDDASMLSRRSEPECLPFTAADLPSWICRRGFVALFVYRDDVVRVCEAPALYRKCHVVRLREVVSDIKKITPMVRDDERLPEDVRDYIMYVYARLRVDWEPKTTFYQERTNGKIERPPRTNNTMPIAHDS